MIPYSFLGEIVRGTLDLAFCKASCNFIGTFAVYAHLKNPSDNRSRFFIHNPMIWVFWVFDITIAG